ncbi:hypothetical protein [Flavobacterium solisilvae]|uniref:Lipoprotein n=1 Tax=Flavobacterium solisilvae TaxID=1852019 RepID=A0ABX1QR42_9FLAO|nr:hypothetical protein [Flavobacterium solisilvae]NMH24709.1 hypothetical protein [Flavobacterium solisilvae]
MKKLMLFGLILFLASCKSKKAVSDVKDDTTKETVSVIKPTEVDKIKSDRAYDLGKRLLETCNTSKFKTFTKNEATDKVIANATAEKISNTCKKINQRNGKFLGIKLLEVKHDKILDEYTFRYDINYEKKLYKRELYVVVNAQNKVSAINTKEVKPTPF